MVCIKCVEDAIKLAVKDADGLLMLLNRCVLILAGIEIVRNVQVNVQNHNIFELII
jgi:hypothetical protein